MILDFVLNMFRLAISEDLRYFISAKKCMSGTDGLLWIYNTTLLFVHYKLEENQIRIKNWVLRIRTGSNYISFPDTETEIGVKRKRVLRITSGSKYTSFPNAENKLWFYDKLKIPSPEYRTVFNAEVSK